MVKNLPAMQNSGIDPSARKIPRRIEWQPMAVFFPGVLHRQEPSGLQSMELQTE